MGAVLGERFGRLAAIAIATLLAAAAFVAFGPAPRARAAGTVLMNETFTGSTVADPLAVGLDARAGGLGGGCLRGASGPAPAGASTLGKCARTQGGTPTPGVTPRWL